MARNKNDYSLARMIDCDLWYEDSLWVIFYNTMIAVDKPDLGVSQAVFNRSYNKVAQVVVPFSENVHRLRHFFILQKNEFCIWQWEEVSTPPTQVKEGLSPLQGWSLTRQHMNQN